MGTHRDFPSTIKFDCLSMFRVVGSRCGLLLPFGYGSEGGSFNSGKLVLAGRLLFSGSSCSLTTTFVLNWESTIVRTNAFKGIDTLCIGPKLGATRLNPQRLCSNNMFTHERVVGHGVVE